MVSSAASFYGIGTYAAGIAGNLFAFVLFVSPIPTFKRIVRNKSIEQFSGLPYVYSLLNCLICMWYGLPCVSYGVILVATVNSIGAAFQLVYVTLFIIYADTTRRMKMSGLLIAVFCVFSLIIYVSLELFDHQARQTLVGYLSVASLISMFASPLFIIHLVIQTRSVEFMPFYLSLATFLMSVSFFAYGMLLHDFFIYIPNGIGTVLGVIQLLVYAYYSRKSREESRLPLLRFSTRAILKASSSLYAPLRWQSITSFQPMPSSDYHITCSMLFCIDIQESHRRNRKHVRRIT
ncbi:bidirectional sugar transporter SWEET2a-like isoform X2 [Phoenix dactylifera]|uniref:Bidirectional sugar transporter SWEET n=1 Tax=Phoenix dactylifera TaxID=42345 RepID=A0A8B9A7T1_PHODC|nr:bidirectional sugar transporter SWEET2a-like isoform X2 [Phoenix dactylifera]